MRLVYLSPVPWSSFAQRPHKFIEWFYSRTGGDVIWVDPYPTRFPFLSDLYRLGSRVDFQHIEIPSWLKVIKPSAIPLEPLPASGWLNTIVWNRVLSVIVEFASSGSILLVIGKPSAMALAVLKRLSGCCSIYDAMDDFPAFYTGLSRIAMRIREKRVVSNVTGMLVSSTALKQRWMNIRPDLQMVHNGVESNVPLPNTSKKSSHKRCVIGYVGTIAVWFDWDWVVRIAKLRANDVIRLIGPVLTHVPKTLPQNIEILPPCTHRAAILAMHDFDVGLIPFKKDILTESVDPIKFYEYRALGLPVISTYFGEMRFRVDEEGVFLSSDGQDLSDLIQRALAYKVDPTIVAEFTACNSWESRFDSAGII